MLLAALLMKAEHPSEPVRIVVTYLAAERGADPGRSEQHRPDQRPIPQPYHAIGWQVFPIADARSPAT